MCLKHLESCEVFGMRQRSTSPGWLLYRLLQVQQSLSVYNGRERGFSMALLRWRVWRCWPTAGGLLNIPGYKKLKTRKAWRILIRVRPSLKTTSVLLTFTNTSILRRPRCRARLYHKTPEAVACSGFPKLLRSTSQVCPCPSRWLRPCAFSVSLDHSLCCASEQRRGRCCSPGTCCRLASWRIG